ncbi:hypothetical protein U1Q18_045958 [Sarracenia purpurea var. burkii]
MWLWRSRLSSGRAFVYYENPPIVSAVAAALSCDPCASTACMRNDGSNAGAGYVPCIASHRSPQSLEVKLVFVAAKDRGRESESSYLRNRSSSLSSRILVLKGRLYRGEIQGVQNQLFTPKAIYAGFKQMTLTFEFEKLFRTFQNSTNLIPRAPFRRTLVPRVRKRFLLLGTSISSLVNMAYFCDDERRRARCHFVYVRSCTTDYSDGGARY